MSYQTPEVPHQAPALYRTPLVDQFRQRLDEAILLLKFRRNSLAPVFHLPNEVLSRIFTLNASSEYFANINDQDSYTHPRSLTWIGVSHVCHHWREVAIACARLWIYLPVVQSSQWIPEMLKRSKNVPVVFEADLSRLGETVERKDMVDGCSRAREIHLKGSASALRIISHAMKDPAPLLEFLSITCNTRRIYYDIPSDLFNSVAPNLRRLMLRECLIDWDSPLLSNLTHLEIHHMTATARPTSSGLLDVLRGVPILETLSLEATLPLRLSIDVPSVPPVSLPHLRRLELRDASMPCANFLGHIHAPAVARFSFHCGIGRKTDLNAVFMAIKPYAANIVRLDINISRIVMVRLHSLGDWKTVTLQSMRSFENESPWHEPDIDIRLSWSADVVEDFSEAFPQLFQSLRISYIDQIGLILLADIATQTWADAFHGTTGRMLCIKHGANMAGLLRALEGTILPDLQTMVLDAIDLSNPFFNPATENATEKWNAFDAIRSIVKNRQGLEVRLENYRDMREEQVAVFKELGVSI